MAAARSRLADRVFLDLLRKLRGSLWTAGAALPPVRLLSQELAVSSRALLPALHRAAHHGLLEVRCRRPTVVLPDAGRRAGAILARLQTRATHRRVALLVPEAYWPVQDAYYGKMVAEIDQEVARHRLRAVLVKWSVNEQLTVARALPRQGYCAAVCIGVTFRYFLALHALYEQRFPLVALDRAPPMADLPTVRADDYAGARAAAECLVNAGHRNLCLVTSVLKGAWPRGGGREDGWVDYLVEHDLLKECSEPLYTLPWLPKLHDHGHHRFSRMFEGPDRPTALVFGAAPWAIDFLRNPASPKVPKEVSVAVFEPGRGLPEVPGCPPLTTITSDLRRVAQCLIEVTRRMLDGEARPPSLRVPMDLHLTASVGPPPSHPPQSHGRP